MRNRESDRSPITKLAACVVGLGIIFLLAGWTTKITLPEPSASAELFRHVRYLASDELAGRAVGTHGIDLARDYIGRQFANYGLLPGGDNGTYYQSVEVVTGVTSSAESAVALGQSPLARGREWTPLGFSASGKIAGHLVFVGYGITAKDYGYDDYAGVDVSGKIVVVLRYEPPPKDGRSPFRSRPQYSRHAALRIKADNAREHGAAGMILVDLDSKEGGERELIPLTRSLGRSYTSLLSVQIARESLEKPLAESGLSLNGLKEKIDREGKPASTLLGLKAALDIRMETTTAKADNIVATLPGADSRTNAEHIVIGAHYDHIGLGHYGTRDRSTEGRIHHGADDNASGTAVLLWLARELGSRPHRLPVTVVFAAFTGEELGLYGSRQYVSHPPLPVSSARAMINLDMVGRLKENKLMVGGGDSAREFSAILGYAGGDVTLEVRPGVGRSDHVSFYNSSVPVLHLFTGVHEDYHRPTDTWDRLNYDGMATVARVTLQIVEKIAGLSGRLSFHRAPSNPSQRSEPIPTSPPPAPNL
jgi:aminopeptidase YwaD